MRWCLIASPDQGDWTGTFGTGTLGEEAPLTAGDHFRIGSNTKTMTSTVILQLVQEGKLALDDPIGKYIPGVPNGDQITIAKLSEMRSGLYSYSFDTGLQPDPRRAAAEGLDAAGTARHRLLAPGELRRRAASSTTATPTSSCWAW